MTAFVCGRPVCRPNLSGMSDRPNPAQLLRSVLPHLIAVALLAAVAGSFYSKAFDGYRLRMPDIEHFTETAKEVTTTVPGPASRRCGPTASSGACPPSSSGCGRGCQCRGLVDAKAQWDGLAQSGGSPAGRPAVRLPAGGIARLWPLGVGSGGHWLRIQFPQHPLPRGGPRGEGDVHRHAARHPRGGAGGLPPQSVAGGGPWPVRSRRSTWRRTICR